MKEVPASYSIARWSSPCVPSSLSAQTGRRAQDKHHVVYRARGSAWCTFFEFVGVIVLVVLFTAVVRE